MTHDWMLQIGLPRRFEIYATAENKLEITSASEVCGPNVGNQRNDANKLRIFAACSSLTILR
jgi:hypothetical protein